MSESIIADALRELTALRLIRGNPPPELLASGNVDRRGSPARTSWKCTLPDGRIARVALGPRLNPLAQRQAAFARACPELIPAQIFFVALGPVDALADEFFDGETLESLARSSPTLAREALARVIGALDQTRRSSNEAERLEEWQTILLLTNSLSAWSATDRTLLQSTVWPRLLPWLASEAPYVRWSNGDFTAANILRSPAGEVRLIDSEFAGETHFSGEDAARFYTLSPSARQCPEIFSPLLPRSGPAWHLFYCLRQFSLEATHNTAEYVARVRTARLGAIRRLAEQVFDCELAGWSVEATPIHHVPESARWEQSPDSALYVSGWCHLPNTSVIAVAATQADRIVAQTGPLPRTDVQAHFGGDPLALASGYALSVPLSDPDVPVIISAVISDGTWLPLRRINPADLPGRGPWQENYAAWSAVYDPVPAPPLAAPPRPLFSILLPVYNPPDPFLEACLSSVVAQHHPHWELWAVDDASSSPTTRAVLERAASADPRIRLLPRSSNGGIARATNDALAAAGGEFVVLLDHDDLLRPHALAALAERLAIEPELDALYSDEDKIDRTGAPVIPFLKPGFSPEFLLGVMYIGHALCVRTSVARDAGGFDPAFDGVQDYEFFLRVTERTRRVGHLARILYRWRQSPGSSALHGNVKGDMDARQLAAVQAHLRRRGRADLITSCGPHRLAIRPVAAPTCITFRIIPGTDPLAAIRTALAQSHEEVLVFLDADTTTSDDLVAELAGVAALPDSGLVAPLILAPDGRVHESGWTIGPAGAAPVMRGFAAGRDGYNGSLPCTREVAAISPLCFAIRRERATRALNALPSETTWIAFCEQLRTEGWFHRVCPSAWINLHATLPDSIARTATAELPDPFFNPNFDPQRADYSLRRSQAG